MKTEKTIVFFYNGEDDLADGYASEALRDDWHKNKFAGTQLVDIGSEIPRSIQCDLMIVEDAVSQVVEVLLPAAQAVDEIKSIAVCYGGTILSKLVGSLAKAPRIMTLDFELQDFGDVTQGALKKTEELYAKICSDPGWRETVVIGITNHSRVAFSKKLVESLRRRNDTVLPKKEAVWPILPDLLWDAIDKHRMRVEANRQIAENQSLRRKLYATQRVIHLKYELLKKTQHLIGIDASLSDIARAIQPYFDWLEKRTLKYDAKLQPKLPTAILLRGEPGCGKSALCQCVADAFQCVDNSRLPKTLGPKKHPGDWQKEFQDHLRPLYNIAATQSKVVVITADDLPLPSPDKMLSTDMGAEWKVYLQTLRDCIYDAISINEGKQPSKVAWIKSVSRSWKGKVLWIFAKNIEDEYAAIADLCRQYELEFPSDTESRRRILESYADAAQFTFADEALDLALSELSPTIYRGRSFVGSEFAGGGFAFWCVERSKEFCRELQDKGQTWLAEITKEIVQEWLDGAQHKAIVAQRKISATVAQAEAVSTRPDQDAQRNYWQTLVKAKLDQLEAAFPKATGISKKAGKQQVRLEDLGKALNPTCSHVVLSNFFNDKHNWKNIPGPVRLALIALLAKNHAQEWPRLRYDCRRLKKYFTS